MTNIMFLFEIIVTFIESMLCFAFAYNIFSKGEKLLSYISKIVISCVMLTIFITICNYIKPVSSITAILVSIIVGLFLYMVFKVRLCEAITFGFLYYTLLGIIEMTIISISSVVSNDPEFVFKVISSSDLARVIYVIIVKLLIILIYLCTYKIMQSLNYKSLGTSTMVVVSGIGLLAVLKMINVITENNTNSLKIGISVLFIAFLSLIVLIVIMSNEIYMMKIKEIEEDFIRIKNAALENELRETNALYQENSKRFHEFKNHLAIMSDMLEKNKYNELDNYIRNISITKTQVREFNTGNEIIDLVFNAKARQLYDYNIKFVPTIDINENINIYSADLCSILSNMLDNAIEAARFINNAFINMRIKKKGNMLFILCENSCDIESGTSELKSRKGKSHGWGLKILYDIANKYDGTMQIEIKDEIFINRILLIEKIEKY